MQIRLVLITLLLCATSIAEKPISNRASFACAACMLIVSEIEDGVAKIDPKKTIDVGSFRINPKGEQQGLQQIPLARSEAHLSELIESACTASKEYKLVVNPSTGKGTYIRKEKTHIEGRTDAQLLSKLHDACNDFVDSYDDEILRFHKLQHENPHRDFCNVQIGACSSVDVTPLPVIIEDNTDNEESGTADILNDEL